MNIHDVMGMKWLLSVNNVHSNSPPPKTIILRPDHHRSYRDSHTTHFTSMHIQNLTHVTCAPPFSKVCVQAWFSCRSNFYFYFPWVLFLPRISRYTYCSITLSIKSVFMARRAISWLLSYGFDVALTRVYEVTSFRGFGQLMGVARKRTRNRMRARALQNSRKKAACVALQTYVETGTNS